MIHLSERGHSDSLAEMISARIRELTAQGRNDIISMNVGQPSTGAPQAAMDALLKESQRDILGYSAINGIAPLRERIAQYYHDTYQVSISPDRVFIGFGASGTFMLAFLGLCDAGDAIAQPLPCYPAYVHTMKAMNLRPLFFHPSAENNHQPTVDDIKALPEKPKMLIVTSPNNPSGSMIHPEQLKALAEYCASEEIILISDEIYHGVVYNPDIPTVSALQYTDQVIVMNSFSKYYSMPGWRVGWMILPENITAPLAKLARTMYVSPTTPAEYVALQAMDCQDELTEHVKRYAKNRDILLEGMPKAGFNNATPPDGAFYYYAEAEGLKEDSSDFCLKMLDEVGIATLPGTDFDPERGRHYVRFSYAGSTESIEEAVQRLQKWRG